MTVMADGVCDEPLQSPPSPSSTHRSPSPLDLRRGDTAPRLPFSISSLLSSSLSSQLSASSRELLGRAGANRERELLERERELLDRERELLGREREKILGRELAVRGDRELLQDQQDHHSESEGEAESEAPHDEEAVGDEDEARDESNGEEDDDLNRQFHPYSYSHMPFAAGLLPQLHGLLPSLGGLSGHGLASHNLMSGPGGVIRVPAHRPPLSSSMVSPIGSSLPWLAGLTPLERTAAMAHHLSTLAPMAGQFMGRLYEAFVITNIFIFKRNTPTSYNITYIMKSRFKSATNSISQIYFIESNLVLAEIIMHSDINISALEIIIKVTSVCRKLTPLRRRIEMYTI